MIDLMDHPNGCFYSDSDDDRHSSSQSATCASDYTVEAQLPSSLRKLLNPILPSVHPPLPIVPQVPCGGPATPPRTCFKKEEALVASHDLTRLRPWKRLPPPRPLNVQPHVSLPPIYVCLPPPRASNGTSDSCSPSSPQFSPYYFPPCHSPRERTGRVDHLQLASECHEVCKINDTQPPSTIIKRSSSPGSRPLSMGKIGDFQPNTKKKPSTYSFVQDTTTRPEQHKASKKLNKANEKERNRCLTCGSAFSTFANLTRHEKKCPMANSKEI